MCALEPSKPSPHPHPTCILSIECKLPPVMSLHLNAQMCTRINITGAPIPKQYTPPAYINTQRHPNKIKSAFRKQRKWSGDMSIGSGMQTGTPYDGTFSTVIGRRWGHEGVSLERRKLPITNSATVRTSFRPTARAGPQMLPI